MGDVMNRSMVKVWSGAFSVAVRAAFLLLLRFTISSRNNRESREEGNRRAKDKVTDFDF